MGVCHIRVGKMGVGVDKMGVDKKVPVLMKYFKHCK